MEVRVKAKVFKGGMDLRHIPERLDEVEALGKRKLGGLAGMGANSFIRPEMDMDFAELGSFVEETEIPGADVVEGRGDENAIHVV